MDTGRWPCFPSHVTPGPMEVIGTLPSFSSPAEIMAESGRHRVVLQMVPKEATGFALSALRVERAFWGGIREDRRTAAT